MHRARPDTTAPTSAWLPMLRKAMARGETLDQAIQRLAALAAAAHQADALTSPDQRLSDARPFGQWEGTR